MWKHLAELQPPKRPLSTPTYAKLFLSYAIYTDGMDLVGSRCSLNPQFFTLASTYPPPCISHNNCSTFYLSKLNKTKTAFSTTFSRGVSNSVASRSPATINKSVCYFVPRLDYPGVHNFLSSTNYSVFLIVVIFIPMVLFTDFTFQWMPMPLLRSSHELPLLFLRTCC